MRALAGFALVALLLSATAFAAKPQCTFRVHLEGNSNDTDVFSSPVQSKYTGKQVFVEKTASISERDVSGFHAYHASDGSYGVLIQLNDHGKLVLDTLSIEHRGQSLFVFLNGRDITELQIDSRVRDGKIYLASGITQADLQLMSKAWPAGKKKR
jgi:hypothetical protein